MQKVIIRTIASFLLLAGCTAAKESLFDAGVLTGKSAEEVLESAAGRNITNQGFFIQKGKIVTAGEGGKVSLFFTMRYDPPRKYLISIRSTSGTEAYRIFLSGDTVLVNDRINKTLLIGSGYDFERITGIPSALLIAAMGDTFINEPKLQPDGQCMNNEIKVNDYYRGLITRTTINCLIDKATALMITAGNPDEFINIEYRKHKADLLRLPRVIAVNDFSRKVKITISINKYTAPWIGEISFIPGSGYSIKPLI